MLISYLFIYLLLPFWSLLLLWIKMSMIFMIKLNIDSKCTLKLLYSARDRVFYSSSSFLVFLSIK